MEILNDLYRDRRFGPYRPALFATFAFIFEWMVADLQLSIVQLLPSLTFTNLWEAMQIVIQSPHSQKRILERRPTFILSMCSSRKIVLLKCGVVGTESLGVFSPPSGTIWTLLWDGLHLPAVQDLRGEWQGREDRALWTPHVHLLPHRLAGTATSLCNL